uniref:Cilia and flagella associated protein 77 n=1 Tax=Sinocyclocheilus grahami TaxID=75366 RepID=A0A672KQN6_SINGR
CLSKLTHHKSLCNYYCRKHPKPGVMKESCQSPKPLNSFAFSLPQTADLSMAVSNSLNTANISNLSVQNKVDVFLRSNFKLIQLFTLLYIFFSAVISLFHFIAISSWHTHTMSTRNMEAERDFIALNREGVKSGLVTAKELQQYRATHDIRRQPLTREGFHRSAPDRIPADASFGVTNRPSTPISELIEYKYAQRWLEEQQAKDKILQLGRIQDTRTTLLRKSHPLPDAPSMWKMPRFQQVKTPLVPTISHSLCSRHANFSSTHLITNDGPYTHPNTPLQALTEHHNTYVLASSHYLHRAPDRE